MSAKEELRPTVLLAMPFLALGGAEAIVSQLCRQLSNSGFRLFVITTVPVMESQGDTTGWFEESAAGIYHLPRFLDVAGWPDFIFHLLQRHRIQVIWQVGSSYLYDLLPRIRQRFPAIAFVDLLFNPAGHGAAHLRYKDVIDHVITEYDGMRDWLIEHGQEAAKISVIPNRVDLEKYSPQPRRTDRGSFVAAFFGRLSEEKGPDVFVDIAARLTPETGIDFWICGTGTMEAQLRAEVTARGLAERVHFKGFVDTRDVLPNCDVVVVCSRLDGRPNIVMESLAMGVPVIASRTGGIPDMTGQGSGAILCEPEDAAGFAGAIAQLAKDKHLHQEYASAARAHAEAQLSIASAGNTYAKLFHHLAQKRAQFGWPALTVQEFGQPWPTAQSAARGWIKTAALLCSPRFAVVTLKNAVWWLRASLNPATREILVHLFDEKYYLAMHPDVRQTGVQPSLHYLFRGFLEARNPSERLDTAYYFANYPDVKRARMNPALHYALFGKREHRSKVPTRTKVIESSGGKADARIDNAWPSDCPLVSVVIPCFNYGLYIEQALQSILGQTFQNFEVIIVEGGSTDGITPGIVSRIDSRRQPKVRVLHRTERHLVGDNRNYGIANARGRYICCLDADDVLKPIYLEMAVFLAEAFAYDLISSSVQCFGESSMQWTLEDATFPAIAECNRVATTALFRKSAWAAIGGYRDWGLGSEYIPEDWDFWLRMLGHGFRLKSIREPLMQYRVHGAGLMGTCETDLEHQRSVIRRTNQSLFENLREAPRTLSVEFANRWTNLIPAKTDDAPAILIALPFVGAHDPLHELAEGMAARGFRVIVITTELPPESRSETPDSYHAVTQHVYRLPGLLDYNDREEFVMYLLRRYGVKGILLAGADFLQHLIPRIRREFPGIYIDRQRGKATGHVEDIVSWAESFVQVRS